MALRPQRIIGDKKTLDRLVKTLKAANRQIEAEILKQTNFGIASRRALQRKIDGILKEVGDKGLADIERTIPKMYKDGATGAVKQLKQIGAAGAVGADFTVIDTRAVAALVSDTQKAFAEAVTQVGRSAGRVLAKATKQAIQAQLAQDQVIGRTLVSRTKMIKGILQDQGITALKDGRGASWTLDRYSEMLVRTKMVEARNTGLNNKMLQAGHDLVMVSDHNSRHYDCAIWEGRILSISGASKSHPSVADAESAGLFHPNCRHAINAIPQRLAYDARIYDPATGEYVPAQGKLIKGSRPRHQVELEEAANAGDFNKVGKILAQIPKGDPYRESMEKLFRGEVDAAKRNVKLAKKLADGSPAVKK